MGRKRNLSIRTMIQDASWIENSDAVKTKHRFADSKYRHKVQFLYDLLRENFKENLSKDNLLSTIFENMNQMENDIINFGGSEKLANYKDEFLGLLELEERIWKKEKDPSKWWDKVQDVLKEILKVNGNSNISLKISSISSNYSPKMRKYSEAARKGNSKKTRYIRKPKQRTKDIHILNAYSCASKRAAECLSSNDNQNTSLREEYLMVNGPEKSHYGENFAVNDSDLIHNLDVEQNNYSCESLEKYAHTTEYLLNNPQWNV